MTKGMKKLLYTAGRNRLNSLAVGKWQTGVQNREKRLENNYIPSFQYKPKEA